LQSRRMWALDSSLAWYILHHKITKYTTLGQYDDKGNNSDKVLRKVFGHTKYLVSDNYYYSPHTACKGIWSLIYRKKIIKS
jgi:hypothetical protein